MNLDHTEDLLTDLNLLHQRLDSEMACRWKRRLPLNELLSDRWQRAENLGFGKSSSIYDSSLVYGDVEVGASTWIGPFTILDGSGGLKIGSFCSISSGVKIYTHDSVKWALTAGQAGVERSPVQLGDCCYIGSQTVIAKGVTIGHHCVVGAGSFVNKSIAPYSVAAGTPCRVIGKVEVSDDGDVCLIYDVKESKAA